jgi:hypothetical protein
MRWRRILFGTFGFVFVVGLAMHWAALPRAGWVIAISAAALVFLFLLPIMGERARQPSDAPERQVTWHD